MPSGREMSVYVGFMFGIPFLIISCLIFAGGYWLGSSSGVEESLGYVSEMEIGAYQVIGTNCSDTEIIAVDHDGKHKFLKLPAVCQKDCPGLSGNDSSIFVTTFEKSDKIQCEWMIKKSLE